MRFDRGWQQVMTTMAIPEGLLPIDQGDPIGGGSPHVLLSNLIGGMLRERLRRWELVRVLEGAAHRSVVRIGERLRAESNPAG